MQGWGFNQESIVGGLRDKGIGGVGNIVVGVMIMRIRVTKGVGRGGMIFEIGEQLKSRRFLEGERVEVWEIESKVGVEKSWVERVSIVDEYV